MLKLFKFSPIFIAISCILLISNSASFIAEILNKPMIISLFKNWGQVNRPLYILELVFLGTVLWILKERHAITLSFFLYGVFPLSFIVLRAYQETSNLVIVGLLNLFFIINLVIQSHSVKTTYLAKFYQLFAWSVLVELLAIVLSPIILTYTNNLKMLMYGQLFGIASHAALLHLNIHIYRYLLNMCANNSTNKLI